MVSVGGGPQAGRRLCVGLAGTPDARPSQESPANLPPSRPLSWLSGPETGTDWPVGGRWGRGRRGTQAPHR